MTDARASSRGRKKLGTTLNSRIHQQTRLGDMLRLYRAVGTRHGRTLRDISRECGISPATLMRIEHGQAFDVDTLLKLAQWLMEPHAD